MAEAVMKIENARKAFGDNEVLKDISIEVARGEVVAIIGPSGGGKSTLASLVPRFWDADEGVVLVGGVDVRHIPAEELMERFVRGDASRSTEGSGLGLSIARSLTELQGGTFTIAIEGDLFKASVELPLTEE